MKPTRELVKCEEALWKNPELLGVRGYNRRWGVPNFDTDRLVKEYEKKRADENKKDCKNGEI